MPHPGKWKVRRLHSPCRPRTAERRNGGTKHKLSSRSFEQRCVVVLLACYRTTSRKSSLMEYARDDEHLCRVIIYNGHVTNSAFLHQKFYPIKRRGPPWTTAGHPQVQKVSTGNPISDTPLPHSLPFRCAWRRWQ